MAEILINMIEKYNKNILKIVGDFNELQNRGSNKKKIEKLL